MIQLNWTGLFDFDTRIAPLDALHKYVFEWVLESWVRIVFSSECSVSIEEQIRSLKLVFAEIEVSIYVATRSPIKAHCSEEIRLRTSLVENRSTWSNSILDSICIHVKVRDYILIWLPVLISVPTSANWTIPLFVPVRIFIRNQVSRTVIVCNSHRWDVERWESWWPWAEDCWIG